MLRKFEDAEKQDRNAQYIELELAYLDKGNYVYKIEPDASKPNFGKFELR